MASSAPAARNASAQPHAMLCSLATPITRPFLPSSIPMSALPYVVAGRVGQRRRAVERRRRAKRAGARLQPLRPGRPPRTVGLRGRRLPRVGADVGLAVRARVDAVVPVRMAGLADDAGVVAAA